MLAVFLGIKLLMVTSRLLQEGFRKKSAEPLLDAASVMDVAMSPTFQ